MYAFYIHQGTAAVNGMEEQDRVDASTNFVVDLWLSLVGGISAIARLTVLFYFLLLDLWLSLVGGISAIAWLTVLFYFLLLNLWLSLVGGISAIARLSVLFYFLSINLWPAHLSPG